MSPTSPTGRARPSSTSNLYDYSVAGVRAALSNAIVGGPGSTGPGSQRAITFLTNFLNHCANDKSAADGKSIPLNFVSFHPKGSPRLIPLDPANPAEPPPTSAWASPTSSTPPTTVSEPSRPPPSSTTSPSSSPRPTPKGCAACSAKENPANAYRNGPLFPAYTAAAMKSLLDLAAEN